MEKLKKNKKFLKELEDVKPFKSSASILYFDKA
jgi:hypothetical protein